VTSVFDFLSVEDVEHLHREQLELFGGQDGVRDRNALEAAVAVPASTFDGQFLHADVFAMAAAYAFHIAEDQPFVDGNKRTALNAALAFLGLNGWEIDDPDELLYDAMIGMSARTFTKERMASLFERLARPYEDD
jgi:death-on-curing protein